VEQQLDARDKQEEVKTQPCILGRGPFADAASELGAWPNAPIGVGPPQGWGEPPRPDTADALDPDGLGAGFTVVSLPAPYEWPKAYRVTLAKVISSA
jgi:hypothetical protein